ncbi:transcriptional regulator FtrA [Azospirillum canadense]|uniref:transcriptional regulator FtrA n=1 Tax=Azospirillum canadense TaxID=403962 RepID=UPI002227470E|nr:transcriptional regulator FtrA [Azospirillum canadense]MCW2240283.1 AraC family transcriptional activator FtrA [Azospirillum canadense]
MKDHLVAALAYDGLCTFEFGCAVEVFGLARPELPVDWYDFAVCGVEEGPLRSTAGVMVTPPHGLDTLERTGTIIVPGWRGMDAPVPRPLVEALRRAHARGARVASICSGVFVLAAAGLLEGRRATTHWRYTDRLRAMHPGVRVESDVLYVDEGDVITSAGSAAGLDMMLHLVRRDHGAAVCNLVARRLVVPAHRDGAQAQVIERPVPASRDARLSQVIGHLRVRITEPHRVEDLARMAAMSERTFFRKFREATGLTPTDWIVAERVALAKDLLERGRDGGRLTVDQIAEACGFGAPETLRHHFRRLVGQSPAAYRCRDGALRES